MLTTGQAAALLGASRQHVVDLCNRGVLPCLTTGQHRRIPRAAVEQLAFGTTPDRKLTRDQERSLWLHRVVAGKLALDPDAGLALARANLARLGDGPAGRSGPWLAGWAAVLDLGPTAVLDMLTSRDEHAVELRQNSPFAGLLTEPERQAALAAFRRHGSSGREADRPAA
ncbi:MAG: helix-turn-helix domain-containing protein [Micromonosporaceae bacterium]|nr:helix-turn-helix domain-containing protein [Micromonosporaceae bacterium]